MNENGNHHLHGNTASSRVGEAVGEISAGSATNIMMWVNHLQVSQAIFWRPSLRLFAHARSSNAEHAMTSEGRRNTHQLDI